LGCPRRGILITDSRLPDFLSLKFENSRNRQKKQEKKGIWGPMSPEIRENGNRLALGVRYWWLIRSRLTGITNHLTLGPFF